MFAYKHCQYRIQVEWPLITTFVHVHSCMHACMPTVSFEFRKNLEVSETGLNNTNCVMAKTKTWTINLLSYFLRATSIQAGKHLHLKLGSTAVWKSPGRYSTNRQTDRTDCLHSSPEKKIYLQSETEKKGGENIQRRRRRRRRLTGQRRER